MMYDKSYYRTVLNDLKPYIKLSAFINDLNIQSGNISKFLKDPAYDDTMSIEKLDLLYKSIKTTLINNLI